MRIYFNLNNIIKYNSSITKAVSLIIFLNILWYYNCSTVYIIHMLWNVDYSTSRMRVLFKSIYKRDNLPALNKV